MQLNSICFITKEGKKHYSNLDLSSCLYVLLCPLSQSVSNVHLLHIYLLSSALLVLFLSAVQCAVYVIRWCYIWYVKYSCYVARVISRCAIKFNLVQDWIRWQAHLKCGWLAGEQCAAVLEIRCWNFLPRASHAICPLIEISSPPCTRR